MGFSDTVITQEPWGYHWQVTTEVPTPGTIELAEPPPELMEFNPDCTCGHQELDHFHDARLVHSKSHCKSCEHPPCPGFHKRNK